jgi:hypothetical protein
VTEPDYTAELVKDILRAYREHADAEAAGLPAGEAPETAGDDEDPDCG